MSSGLVGKPKHVSARQMLSLEAGRIVLLNRAQLDELDRFCPPWVDIVAAHPHPSEDVYEVRVFDRRNPEEKPESLTSKIQRAVAEGREEF